VPGSAGGAGQSLIGKTKTNFVIAANTSYTTSTSIAPNADSMTISVYFTRGEKIAAAHRVIPKTSETGKAAMQALLEGPSVAETAAGLIGAIPEGTRLLGLNIDKGLATVDLSGEYASGGGSLSMFMRIAQVVYTLTQFPSVSKVSFQLDGQAVTALGGEGIILNHPVGRADYEDMAPAILVESPAVGDTVSSPVHISGSANTFEAAFTVDLLNAEGVVVAEKQVMATSGTGQRGTFQVDVPFTVGQAGNATLKVFEQSAKDGSPINVVEIPIRLNK
jgi:germination protein M